MTTISSNQLEIIWSPNHNEKFILFDGNDVRLYSLKKKDLPNENGIEKSNLSDHAQSLILTKSYPSAKCVAWQPCVFEPNTTFTSPDHLLAIGRTTGSILLSSLTEVTDETDQFALDKKELTPRNSRNCVYLVWNPLKKNLLAQGLEQRNRNAREAVIFIWDVSKAATPIFDELRVQQRLSITQEATFTRDRPVCEFGAGESTTSFAWLTKSTFVAGISNKYLRVFDLADPSKCINQVQTKAVYGLCVDPNFNQRLASFCERQVVIWNINKFERPIFIFTENSDIQSIEWCPAKEGLLAVRLKDCCYLKIYNNQRAFSGGIEEVDQCMVERYVKSYNYSQDVIVSFAWNRSSCDEIVTLNSVNNVIKFDTIVIRDRISLNWSPENKFVFSDSALLKVASPTGRLFDEDISLIMRQRAISGYGSSQHASYSDMQFHDPCIKIMWQFFDQLQSNCDSLHMPDKSLFIGRAKCRGACSIIPSSTDPLSDPISPLFWDGNDARLPFCKYRSEERSNVLKLCNWPPNERDDCHLMTILDGCCGRREYERAACIALLNLKFQVAIEYLKKGSKKRLWEVRSNNTGLIPTIGPSARDLDLIALAIAGYNGEMNDIWSRMCSELIDKLDNPYLKAMFAFLNESIDFNSFDSILYDEQLSIMDRVAFACLYLDDRELTKFLNRKLREYTDRGNLIGIVLTGVASDEFVEMLQNYLNRSRDVQTVAIASMRAAQLAGSDFLKNGRVAHWVETYRDMLDRWRMWYQRADFDIAHQALPNNPQIKGLTSSTVTLQIFASCGFCGQRISHQSRVGGVQSSGYPRSSRSTVQTVAMHGGGGKATICQNCRKPLPRCAVCLMNMGTVSGILPTNTASMNSASPSLHRKHDMNMSEEKAVSVMNWFVWCQSCKHGGHAGHMTEWFSINRTCPVNGCKCCCTMLDAPLPQIIQSLPPSLSASQEVFNPSLTSKSNLSVPAASSFTASYTRQ